MLFMCADNFVIQLYPIEEEIDHHNISDVQLYSLRSDLSPPAATDQKAIDSWHLSDDSHNTHTHAQQTFYNAQETTCKLCITPVYHHISI